MFILPTAAPKLSIQQVLITSNVNVLFLVLIVIKCNRDHYKFEITGHGSELGCTVLEYPSFLSFMFLKYVKFWVFCLTTSVISVQRKRR